MVTSQFARRRVLPLLIYYYYSLYACSKLHTHSFASQQLLCVPIRKDVCILRGPLKISNAIKIQFQFITQVDVCSGGGGGSGSLALKFNSHLAAGDAQLFIWTAAAKRLSLRGWVLHRVVVVTMFGWRVTPTHGFLHIYLYIYIMIVNFGRPFLFPL